MIPIRFSQAIPKEHCSTEVVFFFIFFFFLISRKQRVGKQRSLRTAGSLSKEWMAEHEVLSHPLMRGHQAVQPALVVWRAQGV